MSKMSVTLVDYTGAGSPDPARAAANVLVFTKSTRLQMTPALHREIAAWPEARIMSELDYMANTIPSSWEFVDYTFLISNVTRAFTHQFVRTRTASYAQQTMRVLDVTGWAYKTGPSIRNSPDPSLEEIYDRCMSSIDETYVELLSLGAEIEDARGVLPTNILTNITAKFNLRTLAETMRKRASSRTQGEYREVMQAMREAVLKVHPWATLFLDRTFDRAASDLEVMILCALPASEERTRMIKLLDQMRHSA